MSVQMATGANKGTGKKKMIFLSMIFPMKGLSLLKTEQ